MLRSAAELNQDPDSALFSPKLSPGEKLLWIGRPLQGSVPLRSRGHIPILIVAIILALILYKQVGGFLVASTSSLPIPGWVLVFLMLWTMLILVYWRYADMIMRDHACYAVTTERAIILNDTAGRFRDLPYDKMKSTTLRSAPNNRGTIRFGESLGRYLTDAPRQSDFKTAPAKMSLGFILIEDAKEVKDLIEEQRRKVLSDRGQ